MTFATVSPLILRMPDLYATTQDGVVIGLYDPHIVWCAANQPCYLLGQRHAAYVHSCAPETYRLTFKKGVYEEDNRILGRDATRLDINGVRFTIESIRSEGDDMLYEATGWPIAIAHTIPTDDTPCFSGWEDVGHEYLDTYDYDHET